MFKLEINTGNAAFEEEPAEEIIRIIEQDLIPKLKKGYLSGAVRDLNGNQTGTFLLE